MFSPVDLMSWYELFVAVYPSADAPAQQEGAIIIVAIALTILARYGAIMTMALAFSGGHYRRGDECAWDQDTDLQVVILWAEDNDRVVILQGLKNRPSE